MKLCSFIGGCDKPVVAKDLCAGHYAQQRKGKELQPLRTNGSGFAGCIYPGCPNKAVSHNYCKKHSKRLKSTGDPSIERKVPKRWAWLVTIVNETPDGLCREFPFPVGKGRPEVCIDGKRQRASHAALLLSGQPRPEGLHALHSCNNGLCCAPWHLRWGTNQENIEDMMAAGRHTSQRHEKLIAWLDEHGIDFPEDMR